MGIISGNRIKRVSGNSVPLLTFRRYTAGSFHYLCDSFIKPGYAVGFL